MSNGVTLTNLTPVAFFRALLGMTPAERDRVLADKSAEERLQVLAKVREYEALPRDVREERLRQTELHWDLLVLLRLDAAQRKARLQQISPLYLPIILGQLEQWDRLPAKTRKAVLEKESFLSHYLQLQGHSPADREQILGKLPAQQRARWEEELGRWEDLPKGRREELCEQFKQFFYYTPAAQKETIQALSESERRRMEQALSSYAGLPPLVQRQCVESFSRFATMSAQERNEFLQNAAKWEAMSAQERQLWRELVNKLPPMPPGLNQPDPPPRPAGLSTPTAATAANGL
jgi:hypothetical protein